MNVETNLFVSLSFFKMAWSSSFNFSCSRSVNNDWKNTHINRVQVQAVNANTLIFKTLSDCKNLKMPFQDQVTTQVMCLDEGSNLWPQACQPNELYDTVNYMKKQYLILLTILITCMLTGRTKTNKNSHLEEWPKYKLHIQTKSTQFSFITKREEM